MKVTLKLFKVRCQGMTGSSYGGGRTHGEAYVVATDPTAAYERLRQYLDLADLGCHWKRELASVELIAECDPYTGVGFCLFLPPKDGSDF